MKWEDPWFRKLSAEKKLLWQFICDKCDNAGVWKVDYELASFCIGSQVTEASVISLNDNGKLRVKILNNGELVFLCDYVSFQIGDVSAFSASDNATNLQKNCLLLIHKYLDRGLLQESDYGIATGSLRVAYPYRTGIGIGKGIVKIKEGESREGDISQKQDCFEGQDKPNPTLKASYSPDFEAFWREYPRKTGKGGAYKAWAKAKPPLEKCLKALEWQKKSVQWMKESGQYIPLAQTYLNQARWDDEPTVPLRPRLII